MNDISFKYILREKIISCDQKYDEKVVDLSNKFKTKKNIKKRNIVDLLKCEFDENNNSVNKIVINNEQNRQEIIYLLNKKKRKKKYLCRNNLKKNLFESNKRLICIHNNLINEGIKIKKEMEELSRLSEININ